MTHLPQQNQWRCGVRPRACTTIIYLVSPDIRSKAVECQEQVCDPRCDSYARGVSRNPWVALENRLQVQTDTLCKSSRFIFESRSFERTRRSHSDCLGAIPSNIHSPGLAPSASDCFLTSSAWVMPCRCSKPSWSASYSRCARFGRPTAKKWWAFMLAPVPHSATPRGWLRSTARSFG